MDNYTWLIIIALGFGLAFFAGAILAARSKQNLLLGRRAVVVLYAVLGCQWVCWAVYAGVSSPHILDGEVLVRNFLVPAMFIVPFTLIAVSELVIRRFAQAGQKSERTSQEG